MADNNKIIREVFSIAGNICLPTIDQLIRHELIRILEGSVEVINKNRLSYLKTVLNNSNFLILEKRYDELNINFVELTYTLYEVWMSYIENAINFELETNIHLDRDFVEMTSGLFLTCILNDDVLRLYQKFNDLDVVKVKLLGINIEKDDNIIVDGEVNSSADFGSKITTVFDILRTYFNNDYPTSNEFINEYELYCKNIIECIYNIDKIMKKCKEQYLTKCIEIFGSRVDELYNELERKNIYIDNIDLKLHILEYLRYLVE